MEFMVNQWMRFSIPFLISWRESKMGLFSKKNKQKKTITDSIKEMLKGKKCKYCCSNKLLWFRPSNGYLESGGYFTEGEYTYNPIFCNDCGKMQSVKMGSFENTEESKD